MMLANLLFPLEMMLLPTIGAQLWFVGGTYHKLYRRFIWPLIVGTVYIIQGFHVVPTLETVGLLMLAHHLPYGEQFDKYGKMIAWTLRTLVGFSFGAAFYPIFHTVVPAIATAIAFVPLYAVSRKNNKYTWASVENSIGAAEGAIVVYSIFMRLVMVLLFGG